MYKYFSRTILIVGFLLILSLLTNHSVIAVTTTGTTATTTVATTTATSTKTLVGMLATITAGNFYPGFSYFYYKGNVAGPYLNDGQGHDVNSKAVVESSEQQKYLIFTEGWSRVNDLSIRTPLAACQKAYPDTTYAETTDINLLQFGRGDDTLDNNLVYETRFCDALKTVNSSIVTKYCDDLAADVAKHPDRTDYRIVISDSEVTPAYGFDRDNWNYLGTQKYSNSQIDILQTSHWMRGGNYPYAIFCYNTNQTVAPVVLKNKTISVCEDTESEIDMYKVNTVKTYSVTYDNSGKIKKKVLTKTVDSKSPQVQFGDDLAAYNTEGTNNYVIEPGIIGKPYCVKSSDGISSSIRSISYIPCVDGLKDSRCALNTEDPLETKFIPGNIKVGSVSLAHDPVKKALVSAGPLDLSIDVKGTANPQVNLYYKTGSGISTSNADFTKVSMNLTSGSASNGTWSGSIPLNTLTIPTAIKNIVANGELEGRYGVGGGHASVGTVVPNSTGSSFWNEWSDAIQVANGASIGTGCVSGNCMYFKFNNPPNGETDFFTYIGPMFTDVPYMVSVMGKQKGGDATNPKPMDEVMYPHNYLIAPLLSTLPGSRFTQQLYDKEYQIAYDGVVPHVDTNDNTIWLGNRQSVPSSSYADREAMMFGPENQWKEMKFIVKMPQTFFSPDTEYRFAVSGAKEIWLDNIKFTPMYPGIQYYIEVVDGSNKYYENAWLLKKIGGSVTGSLNPFTSKVLPHYVITSDTPATVLPNQPAAAPSALPAVVAPATTGTLIVTTTVPTSGATVYVNDVAKGSTPLTLGSMATGTKNLSLRFIGYDNYSTTTLITAGATTTVNATLVPTALNPVGTTTASTTPVTPSTCTSFTYNTWGSCLNSSQSRTVATSLPSGCVGGTPVITQACTITATSTNPVATTTTPVTCTSFTYSSWGTCTSGEQSRTIIGSSPTNCTGGSPIISQVCTVDIQATTTQTTLTTTTQTYSKTFTGAVSGDKTFDLGRVVNVSSIAVTWTDNGASCLATLKVSKDGNTWVTKLNNRDVASPASFVSGKLGDIQYIMFSKSGCPSYTVSLLKVVGTYTETVSVIRQIINSGYATVLSGFGIVGQLLRGLW